MANPKGRMVAQRRRCEVCVGTGAEAYSVERAGTECGWELSWRVCKACTGTGKDPVTYLVPRPTFTGRPPR